MRVRVAFACGMAVLCAAATHAADAPGCAGEPFSDGQVRSVIDGRTVSLTDGREVRLAGIETVDRSEAALEALVGGREVALLRLGPEADRYGRTLALVALQEGPAGHSVQMTLLERGEALVSARTGDHSCAAALLGGERRAREAGLGLWGGSHYVMRDAGDPGQILAVRGRFAVVEGTVLSVRESGGQIYVNFGRRWSEDFTVTVPKRNERSFVAAGLALKNLAGQRVRVRGTIEERGGPWIEATASEQIEIAERR